MSDPVVNRPRLAARLLIWFLLLTTIPLAAAVFIGYRSSERAIRNEVESNLLAQTNSRAHQIQTYIEERQRNINTLSKSPEIIDAVMQFDRAFKSDGGIESKLYRDVDERMRPFLTYYQEASGYSDLFLISPTGDAVFSVKRGEDFGSNYVDGLYRDSQLAKIFDRAKNQQEVEISDFDYYQATNEPAAFMGAPLLHKGTLVGVVALQLNNEEVYKLMEDYTGLGNTGETVVAQLDGETVTFMAPTRHDSNAAFRRRFEISAHPNDPVALAAQNKSGLGMGKDYRDEKVVAAWQYLPSLRWGMVTKIDEKEAFARIAELRNWSITLGVVTIVAVLLAAVYVSRSISKPIVQLTDLTRRIAAGDLGQTLKVESRDEIGELADAFNKMTADLKGTVVSRDALVNEMSQKEKLSQAIREVVDRLSTTSAEIVAATTQQSSGARQQATAVAETVATVEEVSRTADQAADRAKTVADSVRRSDEVGKVGRKAVEDSIRVLNQAKERSDQVAESIVVLAEQTQAIGEIIATVSEIAEQTNLLSLNASIEASRAGEHGRGFTVVAGEVKALADQSKKSTVQVRTILETIQKATNSAVYSTEQSIKAMIEAISTTQQADDTIKMLAQMIAHASTSSAQILASAGQQATGMSQIGQAMVHINQVATQNLKATAQTDQAARDLDVLGRRLTELLSGANAGANS